MMGLLDSANTSIKKKKVVTRSDGKKQREYLRQKQKESRATQRTEASKSERKRSEVSS
ncbi:hypothetical protein DPMN_086276 [Dreissena polymorpha]|uniref:Uncharacterized protein n=1 Tax=Dreissena polymorpha TaxID=45954 RepID=A0A9D4KQ43_DREPO|nr:hypothetical protein DPMN_086276 [Dreissena polymorpha]